MKQRETYDLEVLGKEETVASAPLPAVFRYWWVRLLNHIAFWVFIYLDETLSFFGLTEPWGLDLVAMSLAGDMFAVYFNLYVLLPRLLLRERYLLYLVAAGLLAIFSAMWSYYIFWDFGCTDCPWAKHLSDFIITSYLPTLTLVGTAVAIKLFKHYYLLSRQVQQESQLSMDAKLKNLRSHLNAHFLLNSLNNLYVLSKTDPSKASDYLLRLSELLRYHLYESRLSRVELKKEIDFIRDYLNLEQLRGQFERVRIDVKGDPEGIKIAPLLFIPFVENAVKHGGKQDGTGFIELQFQIESDRITFVCTNSRTQRSLSKPGGLGMIMARKRFELLYPERYAIWVSRTPDTWTVTIVLSTTKKLEIHEYDHALHHTG